MLLAAAKRAPQACSFQAFAVCDMFVSPTTKYALGS